MDSPQLIFKRYENKYLLSSSQYTSILKLLDNRVAEDKYGSYAISSIYFDTPDWQLVRNSLDKPIYKEKLRLRCYGLPSDNDQVFLEIKKKYKGVTSKRRINLTLNEARAYIQGSFRPSDEEQITKEIDWLLKRYGLYPRMLISYDRRAFSSGEELRITFDRNIRYRTNGLDLAHGPGGFVLCDRDVVLMEVKTPGMLPLWLARSLSEMHIYPCSFSKYGSCYLQHIYKDIGVRKHA
jgi:SPX domain protein involved in polyphosphate accumulation